MCRFRFNALLDVSFVLAIGVPAFAQSLPAVDNTLVEADLPTMMAIEDRLNAAGLCTPLQFDLRTISALLGVPIPAFIPIDTNLRWDQSRNRVTRFGSSPKKVELDFKLGCQPSTNGVALDFFGLSPDKVRLDDKVKCAGDRTKDGELATLVCRVDGKIGRFLSKNIIGLSTRVGKLLPMSLAVPVISSANGGPGASETDEKSTNETGQSAVNSDTGTANAGPSGIRGTRPNAAGGGELKPSSAGSAASGPEVKPPAAQVDAQSAETAPAFGQ